MKQVRGKGQLEWKQVTVCMRDRQTDLNGTVTLHNPPGHRERDGQTDRPAEGTKRSCGPEQTERMTEEEDGRRSIPTAAWSSAVLHFLGYCPAVNHRSDGLGAHSLGSTPTEHLSVWKG